MASEETPLLEAPDRLDKLTGADLLPPSSRLLRSGEKIVAVNGQVLPDAPFAQAHDQALAIFDREIQQSAGRPVELTVREFELLDYLLIHRGHLVSREMLARDVWKEPDRATTLDNVIDVTMARLRKKVDAGAAARLIHTVRGVGFLLREDAP